MRRNLFALAAVLCALAAALEVGAACTAGNPNASMIESTPTSAFTDHGNGTVTHALTGLMWKKCPQGLSGENCATGTAAIMTWSAALAVSVTDTTAGYNDWRVPNKKELESIIEFCGRLPAINQTVFPATPSNNFWSGTTYAPTPTLAWLVYFGRGDSGGISNLKANANWVRLVRGGQGRGSFDSNHPLSTIDVDGNGTADALTDGLLMLRYLFGLRGQSLIQGAVGLGATRKTAAEIESYIESVLP